MIEAVVNVSEGRSDAAVSTIARAAGTNLLDVHSDPYHNRSVLTLAGEPESVEPAVLDLAMAAVRILDLSQHVGVHPRLGVVDVVPFVPYGSTMEVALALRDRFSERFGAAGVPCFSYGPERSLPDVRRQAWISLLPDHGPPEPHPTAGATCVGARDVLVAYNLVIEDTLDQAKEIARALRSPEVRALGFPLGAESQVSFNLVQPDVVGPEEVFDLVSRLAKVRRAELVGLVPERLLEAVPAHRRSELGLATTATIEARLADPALRPRPD